MANSAVLDLAPGATLGEALKLGVCTLRVEKNPIVFGKSISGVKVGQFLVVSKTLSKTSVRQLPVKRTIKLSGLTARSIIGVEDSSLDHIQLPDAQASDLALEDISKLSNGNLSINCSADGVIDF